MSSSSAEAATAPSTPGSSSAPAPGAGQPTAGCSIVDRDPACQVARELGEDDDPTAGDPGMGRLLRRAISAASHPRTRQRLPMPSSPLPSCRTSCTSGWFAALAAGGPVASSRRDRCRWGRARPTTRAPRMEPATSPSPTGSAPPTASSPPSARSFALPAPGRWRTPWRSLARRLDDSHPTAGPVLFVCEHRVFGVGMFDVSAVLEGDAMVARQAGRASPVDVLVGTVSQLSRGGQSCCIWGEGCVRNAREPRRSIF